MERLHAYLLKQDLLLADESRWPLLGARGRKSKNWLVGVVEVGAAEVDKREEFRTLFSPCIPGCNALLELRQMVLLGHAALMVA